MSTALESTQRVAETVVDEAAGYVEAALDLAGDGLDAVSDTNRSTRWLSGAILALVVAAIVAMIMRRQSDDDA